MAAGKYNDGKPERRAELAARIYAAVASAWEQAMNPANQRDICGENADGSSGAYVGLFCLPWCSLPVSVCMVLSL